MGNTLIPTDHEPYFFHIDRQPIRHRVFYDDDEWTKKEKELA